VNTKKIKGIGECAQTGPGDVNTALILIRDLCEAILEFPDTERIIKLRTARYLRKEGYSIREIMKLLKYKSPRSVQDLLKRGK